MRTVALGLRLRDQDAVEADVEHAARLEAGCALRWEPGLSARGRSTESVIDISSPGRMRRRAGRATTRRLGAPVTVIQPDLGAAGIETTCGSHRDGRARAGSPFATATSVHEGGENAGAEGSAVRAIRPVISPGRSGRRAPNAGRQALGVDLDRRSKPSIRAGQAQERGAAARYVRVLGAGRDREIGTGPANHQVITEIVVSHTGAHPGRGRCNLRPRARRSRPVNHRETRDRRRRCGTPASRAPSPRRNGRAGRQDLHLVHRLAQRMMLGSRSQHAQALTPFVHIMQSSSTLRGRREDAASSRPMST